MQSVASVHLYRAGIQKSYFELLGNKERLKISQVWYLETINGGLNLDQK